MNFKFVLVALLAVAVCATSIQSKRQQNLRRLPGSLQQVLLQLRSGLDAERALVRSDTTCQHDYSGLCPEDWEENADGTCSSTDDWDGEDSTCGTHANLGSYDFTEKQAWADGCITPYPCYEVDTGDLVEAQDPTCSKDYTDICPYGWRDLGDNAHCQAPASYDGPLGLGDLIIDMSGTPPEDKPGYADSNEVSWPCEVEQDDEYTATESTDEAASDNGTFDTNPTLKALKDAYVASALRAAGRVGLKVDSISVRGNVANSNANNGNGNGNTGNGNGNGGSNNDDASDDGEYGGSDYGGDEVEEGSEYGGSEYGGSEYGSTVGSLLETRGDDDDDDDDDDALQRTAEFIYTNNAQSDFF